MNNFNEQQRLQRRIEDLQKKWNLLGDVIVKVEQERILETRIEEKLRLERKIADNKAERQQVETELTLLESQPAQIKETSGITEAQAQKGEQPEPVKQAIPELQAQQLKPPQERAPQADEQTRPTPTPQKPSWFRQRIGLAIGAILLVATVTVLWSSGRSTVASLEKKEWKDPVTGMEFVWIKGGEFLMGCSNKPSYCYGDANPEHKVRVDGFWMGKYEVTQAQWVTVMGTNPSYFPQDRVDEKWRTHPVEQVSWDDAQEFIQKLNATHPDPY